jgi:predicted O-linked N-acetylglucosamine transferase (SPINDLY family)
MDVTPGELSRLSQLVAARRYPELERASRELLTRCPGSGAVWKALAIALWMQGKDATQVLERATALLPRDAEVHSDLGTALLGLGRLDEAVAWYRRALAIQPRFKAAHYNLGVALSQGGHLAAAVASFRRALELDPDFLEALRSLGEALQQCGAHEEAATCYRRALARHPGMAEVHHDLGKALQSLGKGGAAEASYRQAIALNPRYVEAHISLGKLLRLALRTDEALLCLERALTFGPLEPQAIVAHAELLYRTGDYRGAVAGFRRALQVDPSYEAARIGAVVAEIAPIPMTSVEAAASCEAYATALAALGAELNLKPCADATALVGAARPFMLAYHDRDDCELMRTYGGLCASLMGKWQRESGIVIASHARSRSKLRIGFVSEYFRNHSVYNAITQGWLQRLDRKRFSVDVFCLDARADPQTHAARQRVDHFEQGERTVREWMRAIVDRRPDVLIYPEVGMNPTTVQLASMRLAKTQMVGWGHPVTSGLPTLDYYLSAEAFEPPQGAAHYTEQLVKLPHLGVYCERPERPVATPRTPGAAHDAAPVLICPGTPFKYAPAYDVVLVDIARRLGRCRFHFFNYEDGALSQRLLERLNQAFCAAGLDGSAFLMRKPWAPTSEFHDCMRSADLMLDTIGFSGFNTVLQALECDLPVVTVRGRALRGRLGSGILERLSLAELVADGPNAYVDIVVSLIENRAALARMRERIRTQLPTVYTDLAAIEELEALLLRVASDGR